ncbi:MAG: type II secretion system GspH family protein [Helicobacteraceae bacterium]|jgi:prepilin-type N-terminal cleavage/methylation domain-containing protein|nr:type II secretion system GspH family protein [Helicobacteraceae bacterium]
MKRAFTLVEIVFSITILAVLSMIGAEIVARVFERYAATRDMERAQSDLRRTLDILAARLSYRIKNSAVAFDKDNLRGTEPLYQPQTTGGWKWNLDDFEVLEWVGIAYESQRGKATTTSGGRVLPGWSSIGVRTVFDDTTPTAALHEFNSTLSNLQSVALPIEQDFTGVGVGVDPFVSGDTILVFTGRDWRGETPAGDHSTMMVGTTDKSWNWIPGDANHTDASYFRIKPISETSFRLDPNTLPASDADSNKFHPPSFSGANNMPNYFLARSAYAVWVERDNLMLAYNFRPWKGGRYDDAATPKQILLSDVSKFLFQESGGVLRLRLCVKASRWVSDDNSTEFCRERSVL